MIKKFYRNKISGIFHAGFILDKVDSGCEIDITAALCMDNKKLG